MMREYRKSIQRISLGLSLCLLVGCVTSSRAESLVRASAHYNGQTPITSRSLFTPPISRQIGDLVVININETTQHDADSELKITRSQVINENGTSKFNGMVGFLLNKLPMRTSGLANALSAPSFNGLNNSNALTSKAEMTHSTTYIDNIVCQVTQVLPNGDLMVQGEKVVMTNKERQNLMVSGIVKPYYLDRNNQISSKMVGGFQMIQAGKGTISRQQNDGIANKIYQFFN
jgi:flagellar L-ring protein FlgH